METILLATLSWLVKYFPKIFTYYVEANKVVIDTNNALKYIDKKYSSVNVRLYFCRTHRLEELKLEGWSLVVGRGRFYKPINYYDKNYELVLIYNAS
jgi:hypothetical protein